MKRAATNVTAQNDWIWTAIRLAGRGEKQDEQQMRQRPEMDDQPRAAADGPGDDRRQQQDEKGRISTVHHGLLSALSDIQKAIAVMATA